MNRTACSPALPHRTDDEITHQAPPQPHRAESSGVARVRALVIERGEQFLAVPLPEPRRMQQEQQRVERSHASPFFSFGFVRA